MTKPDGRLTYKERERIMTRVVLVGRPCQTSPRPQRRGENAARPTWRSAGAGLRPGADLRPHLRRRRTAPAVEMGTDPAESPPVPDAGDVEAAGREFIGELLDGGTGTTGWAGGGVRRPTG